MTNLYKTILEGEKEFDEKYTELDDNGGWREKRIITPSMIKSHIRQQFINFLEAEVEELEGTKKEIVKTPLFKTPAQDKIDEKHNQTLQNLIDSRKELINKLKNE